MLRSRGFRQTVDNRRTTPPGQHGRNKLTVWRQNETRMMMCCYDDVVLFADAKNRIKYMKYSYSVSVIILVMHVAIKCSFIV